MTDFPDDPTLIARGKYATLASDRRDALADLRKHVAAVMSATQNIMRYGVDEVEAACDAYASVRENFDTANHIITELLLLQHDMDELRPLAWGKEKPE